MKTIVTMAAILAFGFVAQGRATDIIDEWTSVPTPTAPALRPVTVTPKVTALLMLDFMNQNCGQRERCRATIPAMKKFLERARANKLTVAYSIIPNTTAADIIADVAPIAGEPHVLSGPDKFLRTDLESILRDKGITTVIVAGTASNAAVLYTAGGAAFRGMNVIVPVDVISAVPAFADLSAAFTLINAPVLSNRTTLTRTEMIKF